MKVKTVKNVSPSLFDTAVNDLISDGWTVHSLYASGTQHSTTLIAFMVKDDSRYVDLGPL